MGGAHDVRAASRATVTGPLSRARGPEASCLGSKRPETRRSSSPGVSWPASRACDCDRPSAAEGSVLRRPTPTWCSTSAPKATAAPTWSRSASTPASTSASSSSVTRWPRGPTLERDVRHYVEVAHACGPRRKLQALVRAPEGVASPHRPALPTTPPRWPRRGLPPWQARVLHRDPSQHTGESRGELTCLDVGFVSEDAAMRKKRERRVGLERAGLATGGKGPFTKAGSEGAGRRWRPPADGCSRRWTSRPFVRGS